MTVAAAGEGTRLTLEGAYRPPLGRLGAGLDRAVLHHVAEATLRVLVLQVADALASPGTASEPETRAWAAC